MKDILAPQHEVKNQSPLGEKGEADLRFGNAQDIPRGGDFGGQKRDDVPTTPYSTK